MNAHRAVNGWRPRLRDFRDVQKMCERLGGDIVLRHVRNAHPDLRFFAQQKRSGLIVLTVRSACDLKHAFCIDTRPNPGTIYDFADIYPLICSTESIKLCIGDDRSYSRIEDVRKVVQVRKTKPGKKKVRRGVSDNNQKRRKSQASLRLEQESGDSSKRLCIYRSIVS